MKIVIELDAEKDKQAIDYINGLDDYLKNQLIDSVKDDLTYRIHNVIKREELRRKQMHCQHEFKEVGRSQYDGDGDMYFDDDGEYGMVERVDRVCTKCDLQTSDMAYSSPRW